MTTSKLLKSGLLLIVLSFMIACDSEELDSLNYEAPTESGLADGMDDDLLLSSKSRIGKCFTLVFPVSVSFPDGSETSFESKEEVKEAVKAFKEANPDAEERPSLVFPIEITLTDGTVTNVETQDALQEIKSECKGNRDGTRGSKCVSLIYPVTVAIPDGDDVEVACKRELKRTIKAYKRQNPDAEESPSIVFPVEVELEDGTTQSVASQEELEALKEDC